MTPSHSLIYTYIYTFDLIFHPRIETTYLSASTYALLPILPFPFIVHPSPPYDTLSPSTKYSGDSHKGWLLQLVDIMVGWACTVPTRERADRRGSLQSIIACTERAALHRAISPPDPLTRVYRNRNTVPPPSLLPIEQFRRFQPPPSNVPSRFLQPPPPPPPGHRQHHHPFAPVVITSIHFTLKAAGVVPLRCPRNEPRASRIFATDCHSSTITSPRRRFNPFPNSRDYRGRDGNDSSDVVRSSSEFFHVVFSPRGENIDDFAGRWKAGRVDG